jgi:hypothetical protein
LGPCQLDVWMVGGKVEDRKGRGKETREREWGRRKGGWEDEAVIICRNEGEDTLGQVLKFKCIL